MPRRSSLEITTQSSLFWSLPQSTLTILSSITSHPSPTLYHILPSLLSNVTNPLFSWSSTPLFGVLEVVSLPTRDSIVISLHSQIVTQHNTRIHHSTSITIPPLHFHSSSSPSAYFSNSSNTSHHHEVECLHLTFLHAKKLDTHLESLHKDTRPIKTSTHTQNTPKPPQSCLWVGMPLPMPRWVIPLPPVPFHFFSPHFHAVFGVETWRESDCRRLGGDLVEMQWGCSGDCMRMETDKETALHCCDGGLRYQAFWSSEWEDC